LRRHEYRKSTLARHGGVVRVPVVVRATRALEDSAQEQTEAVRIDPVDSVIGSDQLDGTCDSDPTPAISPHQRGEGTRPQMPNLSGVSAHHEADPALARERVVDRARIHERTRRCAIGPNDRHHRKPVVAGDERFDLFHADGHDAPYARPGTTVSAPVRKINRMAHSKSPAADTAGSETFNSTLSGTGNNTGIVVPDDVVDRLGAGHRPPVSVDVNGYAYRSTIAVMSGQHLIGVSAAIRKETGLKAGDPITVTLRVDTSPRGVVVAPDFATALDASPGGRAFFDALSNSLQRYHIDLIEGAKTPETRVRRIEKAVALFLEGKPR
jgi:Bacteriocin-protection, YdeI or OmpD-Associated/Domain of unknown function (DUF1905)